MTIGRLAILVLGVSLLQPVAQAEQDTAKGGAFNLLLENDALGATDRHYTSGLQMSYLTAPRPKDGMASRMLSWLPGNDDGDVRIGWQLGQSIYTPVDKDTAELLPDQRPYAAWLYGGLSIVYNTPGHIDTWSVNFGTVGMSKRISLSTITMQRRSGI